MKMAVKKVPLESVLKWCPIKEKDIKVKNTTYSAR